MNKRHSVVSIMLLLGLLLALGAVAALAQGGTPISDWWTVAGGGGPTGGGSVSLNDTLGQPFVGPSSGGSVSLAAGYWHAAVGAESGHIYHFPTILKNTPHIVIIMGDSD